MTYKDKEKGLVFALVLMSTPRRTLDRSSKVIVKLKQ